MKIARFLSPTGGRLGLVSGSEVIDLVAAAEKLPQTTQEKGGRATSVAGRLGAHLQTRHHLHELLGGVHAAVFKTLCGEGCYRDARSLQVFLAPLRRDDHFVEHRRVGW